MNMQKDFLRSTSQSVENKGGTSRVAGKQNFTAIYNADDPRAYFTTLQPLDYRVPDYACPTILRCMDALGDLRGKSSINVLDLCSGYGVLSAVLKYGVSMDELYSRYTARKFGRLTADQVCREDRIFYHSRSRNRRVGTMAGADVAENAIEYAASVNLLDHGFAQNLEAEEPTRDLEKVIAETDIVTIIGGMGYISEKTFKAVLERTDPKRRPWIAAFPLRVTDLDGILRLFDSYEMRTSTWRRDLFPQRRFATEQEGAQYRKRLGECGLTPLAAEDEGYLLSQFYLVRPNDEAKHADIEKVVVPPIGPRH